MKLAKQEPNAVRTIYFLILDFECNNNCILNLKQVGCCCILEILNIQRFALYLLTYNYQFMSPKTFQ